MCQTDSLKYLPPPQKKTPTKTKTKNTTQHNTTQHDKQKCCQTCFSDHLYKATTCLE